MITDDELLADLLADKRHAIGGPTGRWAEDRKEALDYFNGCPYGTEEEGRSSVVTRDVMESTYSLLTELVRVLSGADSFKIRPVSADDVAIAEQETQILLHIFYNDLRGFWVLYSWTLSALLDKMAAVIVYWDDTPTVSYEAYTGLDADAETLLYETGPNETVDPVTSSEDGRTVIRRTLSGGRLRVEGLDADRFYLDDTESLDPADHNYMAYVEDVSVAQLEAEGFDPERLKGLAGSFSGDDALRDTLDRLGEDGATDRAHVRADMVEVTYHFKRLDLDEDGHAELYRMRTVTGWLLDRQHWPEMPFALWSPYPMPFATVGQGVYDLMADIQYSHSHLRRAVNDAVAGSTATRCFYNKNVVDGGDLSTPEISSDVRVDGAVAGQVAFLNHSPPPPQSFEALQAYRAQKKDRLGVDGAGVSLDAAQLSQINSSVLETAVEQSQAKVALMARVMAETGLKRMFELIHATLQRHDHQERVIQLRGQVMQVNPSEWVHRRNLAVNVGMGRASVLAKRSALESIAVAQQEALARGSLSVTDQEIYHVQEDLMKLSDIADPSRYWRNPETIEPPEETPVEPTAQDKLVELQARISEQDAQLRQQEQELKATVQAERLKLDREKLDQRMREFLEKMQLEYSQLAETSARDRTELELESGVDVPGALV